jgi:tRNA pseudouridine55 synthase
MTGPSGIILIDKPESWTSFDVVAKVRNTLKQATGHRIKVGHSGTLDPLATGLLILMVGSTTKRANELTKMDKSYQAVATLGANSTTDDATGELEMITVDEPAHIDIQPALKKFIGNIFQRPPQYSAIKVEGKRAYKLAREGKKFKIKLRPVTIYSITDINYEWPNLSFTTSVSSGTYVRSLVRDIGVALETGAHLSSLRRITVGKYLIDDAINITSLHKENILDSVKPLEN